MTRSEILYDVPFVPNTDDDLHCMQAAYMMIAKYFDSKFTISMDRWAALTGFEAGKGTWENASLLWFYEHGYEVKHLSLFDSRAFIAAPEAYLVETAGDEIGTWQIQHTNIPAEVQRVKELLSANVRVMQLPTITDIQRYLQEGYLVRVLINAARLNGKSGYVGHAVVVVGYDEAGFVLHDPGLPPQPNRKVSYDNFEAAWSGGNPSNKEMDAIRKV